MMFMTNRSLIWWAESVNCTRKMDGMTNESPIWWAESVSCMERMSSRTIPKDSIVVIFWFHIEWIKNDFFSENLWPNEKNEFFLKIPGRVKSKINYSAQKTFEWIIRIISEEEINLNENWIIFFRRWSLWSNLNHMLFLI